LQLVKQPHCTSYFLRQYVHESLRPSLIDATFVFPKIVAKESWLHPEQKRIRAADSRVAVAHAVSVMKTLTARTF
jgi:hypothetical protein